MIPGAYLDDAAAWSANPSHRWVYDKLIVAQLAGVRAGPSGVSPDEYPCIWRPITNLDGMGEGARIAYDASDFWPAPGYFWSERLRGDHISTDMIVENGLHVWSAQARGISDGPDRFTEWRLGIQSLPALAEAVSFAQRHLPTYSGPLNIETIGGKIIEVHLRITDDWVKAGAYDDYPQPTRKLVGTPKWKPYDRTHLETYIEDAAGPRHGIVIEYLDGVGP